MMGRGAELRGCALRSTSSPMPYGSGRDHRRGSRGRASRFARRVRGGGRPAPRELLPEGTGGTGPSRSRLAGYSHDLVATRRDPRRRLLSACGRQAPRGAPAPLTPERRRSVLAWFRSRRIGAEHRCSALRQRGLRHLLRRLAADRPEAPAVLLLEDVHWADDDSLDLSIGPPFVGALPLLVVPPPVRRSTSADRTGRPRLRDHRSRRTRRRRRTAVVAEILGSTTMSRTPWWTLILARGDGNPFYIEEW